MSGILYLVGTPIGNLGDITLRALETLKSVKIIAAEDTRHSRILLDKFDVKAKLVSYYKQKEKSASEFLISALLEGDSVALITDAGMPAISDPGAVLVREARKAGIKVEVVPGPTAVTSAISLAGIVENGGFSFLGFLPEKDKDKRSLFESLKALPTPLVFYVAPHDVLSIMKTVYAFFGERKFYLMRELTKIHEEVIEGYLSEYEKILSERMLCGEFVLILEGAQQNVVQEYDVDEDLRTLIKGGMKNKAAAEFLSERFKLPRNAIYKRALQISAEECRKNDSE